MSENHPLGVAQSLAEPIGWCPWHPEKGYDIPSIRKKQHSCERHIRECGMTGWEAKPVYGAAQPPAAPVETEEYQRCMDMLGDVPGDTLEDRLDHLIGAHLDLLGRAAPQSSADELGHKSDCPALERAARIGPIYNKMPKGDDAACTIGPGEIDEAQMAADFASIPDRVDGPMLRARRLVEDHISHYGMVPHPDRIKEAIATELGLAEIRGADRARAQLRAPPQESPDTEKKP